ISEIVILNRSGIFIKFSRLFLVMYFLLVCKSSFAQRFIKDSNFIADVFSSTNLNVKNEDSLQKVAQSVIGNDKFKLSLQDVFYYHYSKFLFLKANYEESLKMAKLGLEIK